MTEQYQISRIGAILARAIQNQDKQAFMKYFSLSVVDEFYLETFFENYTDSPVRACHYRTRLINKSQFWILLEITYENGERERVQFINTYDSNESIRITKVKFRCVSGHVEITTSKRLIESIRSELVKTARAGIEGSLSDYQWLMDIQRNTREPDHQKQYARALSGSIRYRMSNPVIDCAIILANILSPRMRAVFYKYRENNLWSTLKKANQIFQTMFVHKSYDHVSKDPRKFPFRELSLEPAHNNFDEWVQRYLDNGMQPSSIMCSEIAPLYTAWLSLAGIPEEKQFLISLPFHYMCYVCVNGRDYLIDVNTITCINQKKVYGSYNRMTGVMTPQYYVDQSGHTNMEFNTYEEWMNRLRSRLQCFRFESMYIPWDTVQTGIDLPSVCSKTSDSVGQKALLSEIYQKAREQPESSYTWAKYVHQTMITGYPQCYIQHGLSDQMFKEFASSMQSEEQLMDAVRTLKDGSLFALPYQLMTIRQILQYGMGHENEKMLLYYCVMRQKYWIRKGYLTITTQGAYVLYRNLVDKIQIQNLHGSCSEIYGDIYIAWNEEEHYSKWDGQDRPITLALLKQLL